jgi:hypothetical protein
MAPKRKAGRKSATKGALKSGSKSTAKRAARRRKGSRGGLATVRQVGKKTWKTLKSTTAQVVEGVKETFGG